MTLLAAVAVGSGAHRLEVESDFTKNFRSDSPVVQSYKLVESELGGAGVWDVIVPAPEYLNDAYLDRVRELENDLRAIEVNVDAGDEPPAKLGKVLSLADVDAASKSLSITRLLPTAELRAKVMQGKCRSSCRRSAAPMRKVTASKATTSSDITCGSCFALPSSNRRPPKPR